MTNGTPISACLADVKHALKRAKEHGAQSEGRAQYRALTERMLDEVSHMPPAERIRVIEQLTRDESGLLFGIATSAAIWSVRESMPERLRYGLLALLFENQREDFRETLMRLCLLQHSADKLGVDLQKLFLDVQEFASPEMRTLFESYFDEGERDISAMGYEEFDDGEGFGYRRNL